MAQGEMGVTASTGGRKITLDPQQVLTASVPVREVESTIPTGFKIPWVDEGSGEGVTFDVLVGAGVGSRWLTMHVKWDGQHERYFAMDLEEFLRAFFDAVDEQDKCECTPEQDCDIHVNRIMGRR